MSWLYAHEISSLTLGWFRFLLDTASATLMAHYWSATENTNIIGIQKQIKSAPDKSLSPKPRTWEIEAEIIAAKQILCNSHFPCIRFSRIRREKSLLLTELSIYNNILEIRKFQNHIFSRCTNCKASLQWAAMQIFNLCCETEKLSIEDLEFWIHCPTENLKSEIQIWYSRALIL